MNQVQQLLKYTNTGCTLTRPARRPRNRRESRRQQ